MHSTISTEYYSSYCCFESIAANCSTRSSIADRCVVAAGGGEATLDGRPVAVGTNTACGSKPGAIRRNASFFRRVFSSSRDWR